MSKQNVGTNTTRGSRPVFIDEDQVKQLLDWDEARFALEQAFVSVSNQAREPSARSTDHPVSSQPARTFVQAEGGVLLCMPGFVGHHQLTSNSPDRGSTLACKLITSFRKNASVGLPSINGEVFVFNSTTGKLEAIVEANYLTGVRTATASLVATDHLYLRPAAASQNAAPIKLGIVGCGFQGMMHAVGFVRTQPALARLHSIRLWNRTPARANQLQATLVEEAKKTDSNYSVFVCDTVEDCCRDCDVIVTATGSSEPLVYRSFLKQDVHINAVGAGEYHHAELAQDIYYNCRVYIDHWEGARKELATLRSNVVGEVGEIILGDAEKLLPTQPGGGITVFQSLGMATEDVTVGRLVYEKFVQTQQRYTMEK
ncbi:ketimine reductase mu-crystallin [Anopheles ziemanni]|uniref:ketimine reductase mu-crystallin n=1 Tax=Anopheles coustani TaxID=139045 RepID=UPI00265886E5|nr:ketimine reductase mu-crystallin [Anopheles coustani]XP_058170607.1 ketimine reductase mu-crystallin [Anopheles ziemanni]